MRANPTSPPWMVVAAWAAAGMATAVLLLHVAKFGYLAYLSAIYTGELDYGEGIVWQQAMLIPGPRMYGDLQQYPFLVFHYPPVYHLVANAFAWFGLPWLEGARLVSSLSLLAIAVLMAAFVHETMRPRDPPVPGEPDHRRHTGLLGALVAGLLIFSLFPLPLWARTARVDTLAAAWEMLGMYLGLYALRRPRLLPAAALVFVLAAFTKQSVMSGAIATFAVALLYQRARALWAGLMAVAAGIAAFALLSIATDGGFPRHVIFYNVNRFNLYDIFELLAAFGPQRTYPVFLLIALAMAGRYAVRLVAGGTRAIPPGALITLLYALLATASLIGLGKTGAYVNYFIPVACSVALLTGLAVATAANRALRSPRHLGVLLALLGGILAQTLVLPSFGQKILQDPALQRESDELVAMTRAATKPVLSEEMVLLMQAGKEVPWEPAIITELSAKGVFDERKVIDLIDAHAFAFLVVGASPGKRFDARYSPAVQVAMAKAYPVTRMLAGKRIRLPADGKPAE